MSIKISIDEAQAEADKNYKLAKTKPHRTTYASDGGVTIHQQEHIDLDYLFPGSEKTEFHMEKEVL